MVTYTARKKTVPIGDTIDIPNSAINIETTLVNRTATSVSVRVTYLEPTPQPARGNP